MNNKEKEGNMRNQVYIGVLCYLCMGSTYAESKDMVKDLAILFTQERSSAGQSLAFLQKHQFDYRNEYVHWGQNGNAIRYLESQTPIYVFNQGQNIVGIAGKLPENWIKQLQAVPSIRCETQIFDHTYYTCRHPSATKGTVDQFQNRLRYLTTHYKFS